MGEDNDLTLRNLNSRVGAGGAPGASLPSGVIVMWSGLISSIPSGWVICDGNNGTPNLLARFIKGVATAATNPGASGGAATHTHANHAVTQPANHVVTQPAAHSNHVVTQPSDHAALTNNHVGAAVGTSGAGSAHSHGAGTLADATSGSTVKLFTSSASGVSAATHSGSTATESAHTHAAGTVTQPTAHGAISSHAGTAVDAHSAHSGAAVDAHSGTAVDAHSTVNSEPAYYALAFIMKT